MTQRQLRVFQARRHGEGKLAHLKAQLDIVRVDSPVAAAHPRCEIGCDSWQKGCGRAVTTGGLAGEDHACNTAGRH